MMHLTDRVSGGVPWANLHLIFWLSLFPFTTRWLDETGAARVPVLVSGINLLLAGIGLAFVDPLLGVTVFAIVALIWLVPDRRVEEYLAEVESAHRL